MVKNSSADVIEAYRRRQGRRFPFTFADISKGLLLLIILASTIYVLLSGGPKLPTLVKLKTNTPTLIPSITPTASPTATITLTPTETLKPDDQCNCPSPEILVVTATFGPTDTPMPLPSATETATISFTPTETLPPTKTSIPTKTPTPTASITSTPTQILYTVQNRDTLGGIALRFGVSVEAIQAANNLDNTMIYAGQILQIPKP
ncbi:MAG: LysM peptidoglycan-binding domain-containing protein [Anaerolineales bacterium]|nr:LysM peptidoglycan-binding domain-containing protein [Anaerolineales bacterium]